MPFSDAGARRDHGKTFYNLVLSTDVFSKVELVAKLVSQLSLKLILYITGPFVTPAPRHHEPL